MDFTCITETGLEIGAFVRVPLGEINGRWEVVMNMLHAKRGDLSPRFNMRHGSIVRPTTGG